MEDKTFLHELRQKPHWSYSSISGFLQCSLAWAFRYVYRVERQFSHINFVFGRSYHKTLEYAYRRMMTGHDVQATKTLDLFSDLMHQDVEHSDEEIRFDDGQDINAINTKGRQMLTVHLAGLPRDETVVGVGVAFSTPLVDANGIRLDKPLIGEFDLIVRDKDGRDVIVDWKTSAHRYNDNQVQSSLQPTCYLLAHSDRGGSIDTTTFRFDVITKTTTPAFVQYPTRRTRDDTLRLVELVKMIEKAVRHECFIPDDSSWRCKGCEYSLACQAWHRSQSTSYHNFTLVAA